MTDHNYKLDPQESMSGRAGFDRHKKTIAGIRVFLKCLPQGLVQALLAPISRVPGKIGSLARYLRWSRSIECLGQATYFAPNLVIKHPQNLQIGDNCSIHDFCYLDGYGGIKIGQDVSIAHGCSILSSNHGWWDESLPIKYNPVTKGPVVIEDDVWLGCGVRVLAGATIESRTVVAAGAVVTATLKGGFLYAGVPARQIRAL